MVCVGVRFSVGTAQRGSVVGAVTIWALLLAGPAMPSAECATMRDLVAAAEAAAARANLPSRNSPASAALSLALDTLRSAQVLDEEIATFVGRYVSPDATARARRREQRYTTDIAGAIDTIKAISNVVLPSLKLPDAELDALIIQIQEAEQAAGLEWDLETLRRLERKYGPGSAKLNALEVLVSYSLQRVPAFGIQTSGDQKGRPGPLEVVLAYAPSYITRSDEQLRMVGVFEGGLRQYFFGSNWGRGSGRLSWLRPAYASYGIAWSAESDASLRPPWSGSSRFGAFFGWGQLKVAWLGGENQRVLVTQQFQMIPWVF